MASSQTSDRRPNVLIRALEDCCKRRPLDEKWLVGTSLRAVNQWIESAAWSGIPVVNVRPKTLLNIAHEVAAPELLRKGLEFPAPLERMLLAEAAWHAMLAKHPKGYFSSLSPGVGVYRAAARSLTAIRMAGLSASDLVDSAFEVSRKAREIRSLVEAYEAVLGGRYADAAIVYRVATERLNASSKALLPEILLLIPEDLETIGVATRFLNALPPDQIIRLPVDREGWIPPDELTHMDSLLLRWARTPGEAPQPVNDASLQFFESVAEVNEVREVIRRCVSESIPFDQVELIATDSGYVSLFHEVAEAVGVPSENPEDGDKSIPVTYADGIPVHFARPARALLAWLDWMDNGYPQSILIQMIQDGILQVPDDFRFSQLAETLKTLPILHGKTRYLSRIDWEIGRLEKKQGASADLDENGEPRRDRGYDEGRHNSLKALRVLVDRLLETSPYPGASLDDWLSRSAAFLQTCARAVVEFDRYTCREFLQQIHTLQAILANEGISTQLDAREWLKGLVRDTRLTASAPKPGCLHVSTLQTGGHSGRPYTYLVGLDDARFPGSGGQDPLLLDGERVRLSKDLPPSAKTQAHKVDGFHRLLARLRGRVTVSCAVRDVVQDRDQFPAPVFVSMRRNFEKSASSPSAVSFAPGRVSESLTETEAWLAAVAHPLPAETGREVLRAKFPHLGQGLLAAVAREGDPFTSYDGALSYGIPGLDQIDPTHAEGPALTASALQLAGKCPLAYFYGKVLRLKPPLNREVDPAVWLDPMAFGSVLHDVFRDFYAQLIQDGQSPSVAAHSEFLGELIHRRIERESFDFPPPSDNLLHDVLDRMLLAGRVFLAEEEEHHAESRPVYVEAAFGARPEGEGTPVDTPQPAELDLLDGVVVRVKGRVDRIDQRGADYLIWDYKSGSSSRYKKNDGFGQGRILQHVLYWPIVESKLDARVSASGYIFPLGSSRGERVEFPPDCLAEGFEVLRRLVSLIRSGSFPATSDVHDCEYCEYKRVCRDVRRTTSVSRRRLEEGWDARLNPFRLLRGTEENDE